MDHQPEKCFPIFYGVPFPPVFKEALVTSVINYKPSKDDIFIVSYPKCGSTWMRQIVLLILRHGKKSDDPLELTLGSPFFELKGAEAVKDMVQPGAIKTHLPYNLVPKSQEARYIYVCRNPKDCVVSFYYHIISRPNSNFKNQTFDEFFEYFMRGAVPFGDYFDHITDWYDHKNDLNVYFVTFENLKKDIRGEILKIAKFIGEEYEKVLLNDSKVLDDVIHYSNFENMKKATSGTIMKSVEGEGTSSSFDERKLPCNHLRVTEEISKAPRSSNPDFKFLRKGIVGDWKNHLNPDQLRRIEERMSEKRAKSEFMRLWE